MSPNYSEQSIAEHWIIVGAGSAGCVLANRLSANSARSVTLIEAGPNLEPGAVPEPIAGPNFLDALAEPGRCYPELLARRTPQSDPTVYQRGRGVGGSSAVNAMVALRGNPEIYEGWGWHGVEKLWEKCQIPEQLASEGELGLVDQALLAADIRAERVPLTRKNQRRVTSAEAYLWPALHRPNLTVRADAEVERIIMSDRTATGVQLSDGARLDADRVIVSAGAIHSPALLLRSGVEVRGLGQGLQDHPAAMLTLQLRDTVAPTGTATASLSIASLLQRRIGSDLVQVLPMNSLGPAAPGYGGLLIALMTPRSRSGSVSLDANGEPVVDFRLLDDSHDVDVLTAGVRLGLELLDQPAFSAITEQTFIDDAGTTAATLTSDERIASWLRTRCADYVHASSTCAMGTVVDSSFAVVGYERLFVCDASVFPSIPDVNTHLPTTLAAERFAAL